MALAEHCPEVEVALEHGSSLDILTGIRNGSLGAGFYNEAGEPDAALTTFEVARFGIYLAAPPGIAAASHPPDWQALADLPWIGPFSIPRQSGWGRRPLSQPPGAHAEVAGGARGGTPAVRLSG